MCLWGLCRSQQPDIPNRLWPFRLNKHLVPLPAAVWEQSTSSIQILCRSAQRTSQLGKGQLSSSSIPHAPASLCQRVDKGGVKGRQLAFLQAVIFFTSKARVSWGKHPRRCFWSCTNVGFLCWGVQNSTVGTEPNRALPALSVAWLLIQTPLPLRNLWKCTVTFCSQHFPAIPPLPILSGGDGVFRPHSRDGFGMQLPRPGRSLTLVI